MTGGKDHTVPESVTRATLKQYRHSDAVTELTEFADRGHSLTIDNGWREVADAALAWLHRQSL
jgi:esterase/lipase